MKKKLCALWLGLALAAVVLTSKPVMADEWNKETRLEINEPLEIPGRVLPPGTYIFKLLESPSDRTTVEVYAEDARGRQKFVTTVMAISAYSMETPDKVVIRLEERPSGSPQAIRAWFYPGDNYGWEFVYPKSERLEVAAVQIPAEQPAPIPAATPTLPEPPVEEPSADAATEPLVVEAAMTEPSEEFEVIEETVEVEGTADRVLPETAGHSMTELTAGVSMLGLGLAIVLMGRGRVKA